jgi:hypothetical protein
MTVPIKKNSIKSLDLLFSSEKNFFDNEEIGAGRTSDVALQLMF